MKKSYQSSGFSLVEIMVGITVGVMLLLLVLSIYNLTTKSLVSSESRMELVQNTRIIIERLTRDIRQTRAIATPLPASKDDPLLSAPFELELQDGHDTTLLRYIRYYQSGTDLKRQIRQYYFPADPGTFVTFDAKDDFGNPAQVNISEDELVGQYVSVLKFYGRDMINVEITLIKQGANQFTKTSIYGRNL